MIKGKKAICFRAPKLRGSLKSIRFPAFVETKFDGELNWLVKDIHHRPELINKYGTTRQDSSIIDVVLPDDKIENCILLGELIYQTGKKGTLYKLNANKTNDNELNFLVFDILELNGKDLRLYSYLDRREIMANANIYHQITPFVVHDKTELDVYIKKVYDLGYEGVVVKNFGDLYQTGPCSWIKIKQKDVNSYMLTMLEGTAERGQVVVNSPGGITTHVGVKIAQKYKAKLGVGVFVDIEHQGILPSGSLRHPVFVGVSKQQPTSNQPSNGTSTAATPQGSILTGTIKTKGTEEVK